MFNCARAFVEDPTLEERPLSRNKAIFYSSLAKTIDMLQIQCITAATFGFILNN